MPFYAYGSAFLVHWAGQGKALNIGQTEGQRKMDRKELIVYKEQLTKAVANRHLFRLELERLREELSRVIAELDELDKKRGA